MKVVNNQVLTHKWMMMNYIMNELHLVRSLHLVMYFSYYSFNKIDENSKDVFYSENETLVICSDD